MKKYLIAAAFAALAASPALAATHRPHMNRMAADSYAYSPKNDSVVSDGQVLGADPDPFIRGQLLREGNPGDLQGGG